MVWLRVRPSLDSRTRPTCPGASSGKDRAVETSLGIAAASWGIVMALAPVLQIRRIIVERSSKDVSIGLFAVLLPGFTLWVAYGLASGNPVIFVPNAIAWTVDAATILVALRYRMRVAR